MFTYITQLVRHKNSFSSSVLKVPDHIVKGLVQKRADKRVVCSINGQYSYHCALLPDGTGGHYIMVNKKVCKQTGITFDDHLNIELRPDPTKYGMPMPEEFEEVLETDPEGKTYFEALSPGKQRTLIHMVRKIKSSDLRITKALIIVDHLKRMEGNIDYKRLNQDFKRNRGI